MLGFSAITLNKNLDVIFKDNFALNAGDAIYTNTLIIKRDFSSPESCFLNRKGMRIPPDSNITFLFDSTAGQYGRNSTELGLYGHSVYATTITPCYNARHCKPESYKDTFNGCFGKFTFQDESRYDISTTGNVIQLKTRK